MSGEIAAVHRGDIARLERPQVLRVVPVVEVAAVGGMRASVPRVASMRSERVAQPAPAEVARRDDRQQVQADVGRRGAVRDHRPRVLLEIVGRQMLSSAVTKVSKKRHVRRAISRRLALLLSRQRRTWRPRAVAG